MDLLKIAGFNVMCLVIVTMNLSQHLYNHFVCSKNRRWCDQWEWDEGANA